EEDARRRQGGDGRSGGGEGARDGLEVDMRGEVRLAGLRERIDARMALQRLERVAERAPAAVVDDQRRAATPRDAPADLAGDGGGGRAGLHHVPDARVGKTVAERGVGRRRAEAGGGAPL